MPQCFPALSPAAWKPERPMRATVGVMVSGPIYLSRAPGRPRRPMTTSINEDMMIAPWIWNKKGHSLQVMSNTENVTCNHNDTSARLPTRHHIAAWQPGPHKKGFCGGNWGLANEYDITAFRLAADMGTEGKSACLLTARWDEQICQFSDEHIFNSVLQAISVQSALKHQALERHSKRMPMSHRMAFVLSLKISWWQYEYTHPSAGFLYLRTASINSAQMYFVQKRGCVCFFVVVVLWVFFI